MQAKAETRDKTRYLVMTGLIALTVAVSFVTNAFARSAPDSFADLTEKLSPAVVNISTTQIIKAERGGDFPQLPPGHPFEDFFKDFGGRDKEKKRKATSLGSGFVIDKDGLVVTNNHVIDGADEIFVIFQDGEKIAAEVVGTDPKTDVAVLRIDPDGKDITSVKWGDSDKARVGDWVLAIGNPFGLGGTVTAGIISARGRDIRSGPYDDYIQTDASINKGNSGGPLFNMKGEVIGINTAIFSQSGGSIGIGFSVPSELAQPVVAQLIKYGKTRRGWLGVVIQNVTEELADGLGLDNTDGVLIAGVPEDGPAFKAGIKAGDVVLKFNGQDVSKTRELSRLVAETAVGAKIDVELWRNGERITKTVTLGELEKAETQMNGGEVENDPSVDVLGMSLSTVTPAIRERYKLSDDVNGVIVVDVADGSEAAEKDIRPGDQILEVQLKPVSSVNEVKSLMKDFKATDRKSVLMLVKRGLNSRFVALSTEG
ncbi:DegQ family serine endoprotease [Sneathiella chinensis]|uniref:Probable periplasmic serine endoprotease DegP-like n=1 Tax=Sneathiella chinensis TaxID=349750 RepID=A0ABQ5U3C9_9PROT|nr:DegQ family serine endoprotease [Sneathiella chinensis]GLQ06419.1 serine protease [Sneathiella chinensis]